MRRILTAVLLIPLVVCLILWGPAYLLVAVQLAITEVALWEFFRLAEGAGAPVIRGLGFTFAAAIAILSLAHSISVWTLATVVLFLMVLLGGAMLPRRELSCYLDSVSATLLGALYIALPLGLLVWICLQPGGRLPALFVLVVVWTGDTAAFFAGSKWGRHKLAPRISPGKTWEGSAASLAAAILTGLLFARFFLKQIGYLEASFLATIVNVAAQIGDLAESALKRNAGVKDSSNLVPGHGGVLDRIDALLFAAPVLWYYWSWRMP
ncbi:MAG: phosphatidate cytidylyltransferase [Acidobacteria bacterium]|nr:phosphatidate cytidylyltransferase [Acidobacteriota bacterium]